jgi:general secretion pathway protein J
MTNARGFTLMEVLVAMVLLSLFAVVAYRALDAVLNVQRHATARMDDLKELAAAFAVMASDLSNTAARFDPQNPGANQFNTLLGQDGAMQLDFVRLLPDDADQGLQRTGYRCTAATLSRLVWPDMNDPAGAPKEFTLLSGLRSCAFRYLNAEGQWLSGWHAEAAGMFPRAVELAIAEADGTPIRRVLGVQ